MLFVTLQREPDLPIKETQEVKPEDTFTICAAKPVPTVARVVCRAACLT